MNLRNKRTLAKSRKTKETYPHFRHYKKSGHPALILSPEGDDKYKFRRVTSSEFSGHHKNEKIEPNPDKRRKSCKYCKSRIEDYHIPNHHPFLLF